METDICEECGKVVTDNDGAEGFTCACIDCGKTVCDECVVGGRCSSCDCDWMSEQGASN